HGPAKVKGWKLLESCGVQIITFTTTQLILLVEKKYPLTRFTLDQMLNAVRLEVEVESEVALELLRLQALVDRKKVMITEVAIRDVLRLNDVEGVDCLPNKEIFAELPRMGYEKPSTKLTFYKAFFSSQWNLVRNVDSTSKFYMYPRFIQLLIKNQLGDLSTHTTKYTSPAPTQKVFANIKRVGKGFSGVETPLFEGMIVAGVIEEEGDAEEQVQDVADDAAAQGADTAIQGDNAHEPSIPYPTLPTPSPQPSQDLPSTSQRKRRVKKLKKGNRVKVLKLRRLKKVGTLQRINTSEDTVIKDASNQGRMIDDLDKDDVVALMDDKEEEKKEEEVNDDHVQGSETVTASSTTIFAAQPQVPAVATTIIAPVRVAAASTRRRKGVVIRDPEEESTTIIPADTNSKYKGKGIMLEEEESKAIQRISKTPAQKAAKRRKLNEEVKDLKSHLEIMLDEDDGVYTKATPLARKVPVVDYEIIHLNSKPHYKIIRADGTHQRYQCLKDQMDKLKYGRIKGLSMVKRRLRAGSCWNHVVLPLLAFLKSVLLLSGKSQAVCIPQMMVGFGGIECIFVGYAEHSKAFRFYVIKPNESALINSITESRDAIFDENGFFLVLRPSLRIPNRTEDIGGDPKTFDEAMKSQDAAFWKEAINDEIDSIMGNNTWVLADLPLGCKSLGCKWIFKRKLKLYGTIEKFKAWLMDVKTTFLNGDLDEEHSSIQDDPTKEFLLSRFSIKDMGEADVILGIMNKHESNGIAISQSHYIEKVLEKFNYFDCTSVSTHMDTSEKLMPNHGQVVSQLEHSRVIGYLMYVITCTRPDIVFVVVLEGYTDVSRISNTEDKSSISGWVFLLGGGAIYLASKKQTCITGSTIKFEFVALAAAGKEAKWLKNLLLEIPLWSKPIAPISTRCGCSRSMTENMSYQSDFKELNGGYVAFGELKFNLFSVSQMCDKKNGVLFIDTECLVLSPEFKLPGENQVLLRVLRENNMYNVNLKNIGHSGDLTCLFAKAKLDESNLWHIRLGHINFKTMNKLVKGNLVRGLPAKVFKNDNTCVTCKKGKQHRASCKTMPVSSVNQPFYRLHMDLFGPTFVKSLNKKSYCLVFIYDYSRFTWLFFLATKDETSPILKIFITCLENQLGLKVKVIKSDNRTEFKNNDLNQFCGMKGIKRELSVPRTPQQNGIAERKNKTLIEAARTMLADSLLPIPFWAEEPEFDGRKPESEVNVSPSSRYRNLSAEFKDFSDNSINEGNAAGTLVLAVGQLPLTALIFSVLSVLQMLLLAQHMENLHV
nr:putative ribonuclease H-like domain-containing protein [Tanacetum cinerariifolium]